MPKFIKGLYLFTIEELNRMIQSYDNKDFVTVKNIEYIPLETTKKSEDIDPELFEELIMMYDQKKEIYENLRSTYFKLERFCKKHYNTASITEIRKIIQNRI